MRFRLTLALLLAGLCLAASGCSLDGQVLVHLSGGSPATVTETIKPEQTPYHVAGVTSRRGRRVGIDCAVTMAYDVKEATGTAVLIQRLVTRLRTRPLPRGVPYAFDCLGPLVVELPQDASGIRAQAIDGAGASTDLTVRPWVPSVHVGFGRRLRPESFTQLVLVRWPAATPPGSYSITLAFNLPTAHTFSERAVFTASVACGRSRYLQPILPPVTAMSSAWALTIHPSSDAATVPLPRLAPGISSQAERTRTLACAA